MARLILMGGVICNWNIDANVGLASANRQDDVELVQLGFIAMLKNGNLNGNDGAKGAASAIVLGAPCSGRRGDVLVDTIIAFQQPRGSIRDGHVSVMKQGDGTYADRVGRFSFVMATLNNNLFDLLPNLYPRLDLFPGCPPRLKATAKTAFVR